MAHFFQVLPFFSALQLLYWYKVNRIQNRKKENLLKDNLQRQTDSLERIEVHVVIVNRDIKSDVHGQSGSK